MAARLNEKITKKLITFILLFFLLGIALNAQKLRYVDYKLGSLRKANEKDTLIELMVYFKLNSGNSNMVFPFCTFDRTVKLVNDSLYIRFDCIEYPGGMKHYNTLNQNGCSNYATLPFIDKDTNYFNYLNLPKLNSYTVCVSFDIYRSKTPIMPIIGIVFYKRTIEEVKSIFFTKNIDTKNQYKGAFFNVFSFNWQNTILSYLATHMETEKDPMYW